MKHWIITILLSIPALIISITALAFSCPSKGNLEADYIGIIVSILSILVTLLVTWNILQSVRLENKMKEIKSLRKDYDKVLRNVKELNKTNKWILETNISYIQAELYRKAKMYISALKQYMQVLFNYDTFNFDSSDNVPKIKNNAVRGLSLTLEQITLDTNKGDRIFFDADIEYDGDFLKYRNQLQSNEEYKQYFKRIDACLLKFYGKEIGGVFFRFYKNNVIINDRPHTMFLLLDLNMSPIFLCFDSNTVNEKIGQDYTNHYKYIGTYSYANTSERDFIIRKIKLSYSNINIKY